MGCNLSKAGNAVAFHADGVDDSIHAMLQKEERLARKNGETPRSYCPRAPHPLFAPRIQVVCAEEEEDEQTDDKTSQGSLSSVLAKVEAENENEVKRLLFHTKHHCDVIDRRDLSASRQSQRVIPGTC